MVWSILKIFRMLQTTLSFLHQPADSKFLKKYIFGASHQTFFPSYSVRVLESALIQHVTEVGRAPLIDIQKWFLNKVFYRLFRKFKFYTWMTVSGRKSVEKGQKMTKMPQIWGITRFPFFFLSWLIWNTRNPASRASQQAHLVAMYIAVAIRLSSYVHRVTSEAVSFLPEVLAKIWLDPLWGLWGCWETFIWYFFQ